MFRFLVSFLCMGLWSTMACGGMIYDVEGIFAPSFTNEVAPSFVGSFDFPNETVDRIEGWVELTNEPDILREFAVDMTLNLPATLFQPWDTRLYAGMVLTGPVEGSPMTMLLVDYDAEAGSSLDPTLLEGGGGWDAWNVSFVDYPAGSLDGMTAAVNEPSALALLAFGAVVAFGIMRSVSRM